MNIIRYGIYAPTIVPNEKLNENRGEAEHLSWLGFESFKYAQPIKKLFYNYVVIFTNKVQTHKVYLMLQFITN